MLVRVKVPVVRMRMPCCGLRNSHHETTVLHAFEAYEPSSEHFDLRGLAADDKNFKAGVMIEMSMAGGDNEIVLSVLQLNQFFGDAVSVVIVDQRDGADDGAIGRCSSLGDEAVTDKVAKCLGAIGVTASRDGAVKALEKIGVERNANSGKDAHYSLKVRLSPKVYRVTRLEDSCYGELMT